MGLRICTVVCARLPHFTMAPRAMKAAAMKGAAMKGAALSKSGIASAIAEATKEKPAVVKKLLESLAEVATKEVKKNGKFTVPGLVMIKSRVKPATKAGKRLVFGKETMVKAKPAKTVVKGFCVAALKKSI